MRFPPIKQKTSFLASQALSVITGLLYSNVHTHATNLVVSSDFAANLMQAVGSIFRRCIPLVNYLFMLL